MSLQAVQSSLSGAITLQGVLIAACVIFTVSWLWSYLRLPGPWGLPVIGYYPFLKKDFYKQLHEMTKRYGEVYFINIGGQTYLYLGSLKALREAHVTKADCFASRSEKHSILQHAFREGVLFLNGETWRVQRKLFVQSMRDLGLTSTKNKMKGPVEEAVHSALESLHRAGGEPVDMTSLLSKTCTTAVVQLILGYNADEQEVEKLNQAYYKMLLPMGDLNILLSGNIAKYLLLPTIRGYFEFLKGTKEMRSLLRSIVNRRKANFDPDLEPQDFIDYYFKERASRERKGDPQAKIFSDEILVGNLVQAYGDGTVSIGAFLASYLRDLSAHKEAQDKIHEEIVNVMGTERLPTWEDDRSSLPLSVSTIKELLRISKFFPVFLGLECTKETTVLGVNVPKGCITIVPEWAIHHDSEIFENPDDFDATRFLSEKSKGAQIIHFGFGKRACAGESLVMSMVFMFLTAICQNFLLLPVDDQNVKNKSSHEQALDCWVRAVPRSDGRFGTSSK